MCLGLKGEPGGSAAAARPSWPSAAGDLLPGFQPRDLAQNEPIPGTGDPACAAPEPLHAGAVRLLVPLADVYD